MAQIVPNPTSFGAGLGRGLSAGLTQLAEQKFAELERRSKHSEKANRLKALGLSHEESDYLAGLEDKFNYLGANNYFGNRNQHQPQEQQEQQPQQEQQQGTLEQLANSAPSIPGASKSPEQLMLESLASGQPLSPIQALMKSLEMRGVNQQQMGQPQSTQPNETQQPNAMMPQMQNEAAQQMQGQVQPQMADTVQQQQQPRNPSIFGGSGTVSASGLPKPLTEAQVLQSELNREKFSSAQQAKIDKSNESFNKELDKVSTAAKELLEISNRMEGELDSGKVSSAVYGQIQEKLGLPKNESTSNFDADAEAAAILRASLIPGVTTNERLKAARRTKPNISQPVATQRARIKVMRDDALAVLEKDQARNQLIEENGGVQPANLRSLVEKRVESNKSSEKEMGKTKFSIGQELNELPDPKSLPEGFKIELDNGSIIKVQNKGWVKA